MTDIFLEDDQPPSNIDPNKQDIKPNKTKRSRKRTAVIIAISIIMIYLTFSIALNTQFFSPKTYIYTIDHTTTLGTITCTLVQITHNNSTFTEPFVTGYTTTSYYYNTSNNPYNQSGIIITITHYSTNYC